MATTTSSRFEGYATALAIAAIVVAPLPFGAVHPRSATSLQLVMIAASSFALFAGLRGRELGSSLRTPLLAFGLLILLQLTPLPLSWLGWLSPGMAERAGSVGLSPSDWQTPSHDPWATRLALLRGLAIAAAFWLAAVLGGRRRGLWIAALIASGATVAAVGWAHELLGWDSKLFGVFAPIDAPSGQGLNWPFLNPSHFSLMLAMALPLAVTTFLQTRRAGGRLFSGAAALLMASALLASDSRTGLIAAGVAAVTLVLLLPRRRAQAAAAAAVVGLVGLLGLWGLGTFDAPPRSRDVPIELPIDQSLWNRLVVAEQSLDLVRDHPVVGTGLGTWRDSFHFYQRYPLKSADADDYGHAHDDYVQWLSETGGVGAAIALWLLVALWRRLGAPPSESDRQLRSALWAALAAAAAHAFVDFGLRIPALALWTATAAGLLWTTRARPRRDAPIRPTPWATAFAVAALGLWAFASTSEWRDQRVRERAEEAEVPSPLETGNWRLRERIAWTHYARGEDALPAAAGAVRAAPFSYRPHRTLAFVYHNRQMRQLELDRAAAARPNAARPAVEAAMVALVDTPLRDVLVTLEDAFYRDPRGIPRGLRDFRDPITGAQPFLEAARRGIARRVADDPTFAADQAHRGTGRKKRKR